MQATFDQRSNNFDIIRLALSVLVIFSHSYPLGIGSEVREPIVLLTHGQVTAGHVAVDLFFIISGFLITASYERSKSGWSYMKKRIARIYPGFIVTMLLCALVVVPLSGGRLEGATLAARVKDFVVQTVQLREFHSVGAFAANPTPGAVNGSMWSIPYEFWCYIGVLLLGLAGLLRSRRAVVGIFLFSIVVSLLFAHYRWTPGGKILGRILGYPPFWARLLPMYMSGIVFYRLRDRLVLKGRWIALACAGLVLAAVLPLGWTLLFPIAGAYLVLVLAYHPAIRFHGWNRFGDFSYGTYLYAFPIEQLIVRWIGHPLTPFHLFALATPPTLLCAVLSWHLVEKRFLRAAHKPALRSAEAMAG
ncbi:MAG: acyltransferase [Acidobacteria bacterium]|nr:acyltransferase [Acidobacteriota bacterium]